MTEQDASAVQQSMLKAFDDTIDLADAAATSLQSHQGSVAVLRFLAALSAVNRADDLSRLLNDGGGGAVAAALARGLLEQACCETWLGDNSPSGGARLISLEQERQRLIDLAKKADLAVPNMMRWLAPYPLADSVQVQPATGLPNLQKDLTGTARKTIPTITRLPSGIAELLAMSSHANIGGTMATVGPEGHPMGFSLAPEWAAIIAQVAGTALATATHVQSSHEVDPVADLVAAAQQIHHIPQPTTTDRPADKSMPGSVKPANTDAIEFLPAGDLQDELLEELFVSAGVVQRLLSHAPAPWNVKEDQVSKMAAVLPYLTCLSTADVALSMASGTMTGAAVTTAARMLLEEAARLHWLGLGNGDEELWHRYVAIADRATKGRQLVRQRLTEAGTPADALRSLFNPTSVKYIGPSDKLRTPPNTRTPQAPAPGELLRIFGKGWAEPRWFEFAYSLLSQVVHATPLGDLHLAGRQPSPDNLALSHEMTALAVDCACIGATTIATRLAAILSLSSDMPDREDWAHDLMASTVRVHSIARVLHFLD